MSTMREARTRIGRYLSVDKAKTDHLVEIYRSAMQDPTPTELMIAIVTDFQFRKNTTYLTALKADQGTASVYTCVSDWKTPVMGGVLRLPHTIEVPFVFGTTKAAAALVGTGPELPHLTSIVMNSWIAFAHTGNPNNKTIPHWPGYADKARPTIMLDTHPHIENDPGGAPRRALAKLPAYEYAVPLSSVRA
jgi:para-nitrobenzyl esterase